jgi:hypothetical protein
MDRGHQLQHRPCLHQHKVFGASRAASTDTHEELDDFVLKLAEK